jgi:hypothetical protein
MILGLREVDRSRRARWGHLFSITRPRNTAAAIVDAAFVVGLKRTSAARDRVPLPTATWRQHSCWNGFGRSAFIWEPHRCVAFLLILEEPRGGQERKQDSEELMIRMLIVGYCYGIRFERRLCNKVELHVSTNSRVKLLRNDYATFLSRRRGGGDYNSSGRQRLYSALQANSRV